MALDSRFSLILSDSSESSTGPSASARSMIFETSDSSGSTSSAPLLDSRRSGCGRLPSAPQLHFSVVIDSAFSLPRRMRSNSVAVNSVAPGSVDCRSSGPTSAGGSSDGGSCSYSRS